MKRKLKLFIASSAVFALAACSAPNIQPSASSSFSDKQEESSDEANPVSENSSEESPISENSSEENPSEESSNGEFSIEESSSEEKRYFTIRWENYDGVLLELDEGVAEGMSPTYDGSIPRRESDESYDYVFTGWTPEVVPAYEDATYVATYRVDALPVRVEVTFDANGGRFADGSEKKTVETVAGSLLTAPESPRKGGYSFSGWALSNGGTKWNFGTDKIESNVTLYAQWDMEDGIVFGVEGASVDQNSLSIWMLVDSLTTSVSLSTKVTVSSGTTWKLYRGESEIPTKIATTSNGALIDGDNQFYIVTSANGGLIEKTYELTIYRSYYVPMRFYFNDKLIRTEYAPTGYEWELPDTQKIAGYSFSRWVDAQGSEVNKVTPFSAMVFYAVATANSYAVTLNPAGGSVAQTEMLIDYDSSYQLPVPTRTGYTFDGWYYGNSKLPQSGTWGIPENAMLTARWEIIVYSITYNLSGGTNSAGNPSTYTVEDEFDFAEPSKVEYSFGGWEDEKGNLVTGITAGTVGDLSLAARWEAVVYTITYYLNGGANDPSNPTSYTVEDGLMALRDPFRAGYSFDGWYASESLEGKVTAVGGGGRGDLALYAKWTPIAYSITYNLNGGTNSAGNPSTYTVEDEFDFADPSRRFWNFEGWYSAGERMVGVTPGTTGDLTIEARWSQTDEQKAAEEEMRLGIRPSFSEDGKTVTYGMYPQARVSDAALISELNDLPSPEGNGWYLLGGEYYAKATASPLASAYAFSDGARIQGGADYWFAVEPIKWRVLESSGGECLLLSDLLLDVHGYDASSNNYANSEIRSWLNADFYEAAFVLGDSYSVASAVDNSAATTDSPSNPNACENTSDRVFLLSYQDYCNASYGFLDNSSRQCSPTDYAVARGASKDSSNVNGYYWTRSPDSGYSNRAWVVTSGGNFFYDYVYDSGSCCVRLGLRIAVSE